MIRLTVSPRSQILKKKGLLNLLVKCTCTVEIYKPNPTHLNRLYGRPTLEHLKERPSTTSLSLLFFRGRSINDSTDVPP